MKILHYALGFPPYRTGGLTKYCMDLMLTQKEHGNEIAMLWPGKIGFVNHKIKLKKTMRADGITSFELINPLPVSLDEGIADVDVYMRKGDINFYKKFLSSFKPDAIHIHTLMGLHKEFLLAANELRIKTVFTTHDYYGLCPKVTLFCNGHICDDDKSCGNCIECNKTALSHKKIIMMQSSVYRKLKDWRIIKKLRRRHRQKFFDKSVDETENIVLVTSFDMEEKATDYQKLRQFYISMYEMIDTIHFNSTVSQMVYKRYFKPKNEKLVSISHRGIVDHRKKKNFDNEKLRITYLSPAKPFKGFNILKKVLDELWDEGHKNFELNMFSLTNQISTYMKIQDGYKYEELESIFDRTDLMVAPSVWYETFGFTVLEALSYGVPILVSENVGAKDIQLNCGWVCDLDNLHDCIKSIYFDRKLLAQYNEKILMLSDYTFDCEKQMETIFDLYQ